MDRDEKPATLAMLLAGACRRGLAFLDRRGENLIFPCTRGDIEIQIPIKE